MSKYYISKEVDKTEVPVYGADGVTVIATRISMSSSFEIHESLYNTLSEEEKKKYVEKPSEN